MMAFLSKADFVKPKEHLEKNTFALKINPCPEQHCLPEP